MAHRHKTHTRIERAVRWGWQALIRLGGVSLQLATRLFRRTFHGYLGPRTAYVVHTSPMPSAVLPDGLSEEVQAQIRELMEATAQEFRQGRFFLPLALQTERTGAVFTTRIRQGETGNTADHLAAIFPVSHDTSAPKKRQ